MATVHFTQTEGVKGGAGQVNVGIKNAPRDYRDAVEAWLAGKDAKPMQTNTDYEIARVRLDGVVITMHGTSKGRISVSLQGETVKLPGFPLPENCYSENEADLAAVKLAFEGEPVPA